MPSLGFRGARGMRIASPITHFVLISGALAFWKFSIDRDREPVYRMPPPPVPAPAANVASLENMMEMDYRRALHPSLPLVI